MNSPIRIMVVDDHPVVRDGLVAILTTQPDFLIAGEASNGRQVMDQVDTVAPDVVLLDLEMPEMDGVEVTQRLSNNNSSIKVLVFTAYDTDERVLGALQAGAKGYLLKGAPRSEIFNAIRVVAQGGSLLQPVVASRLLGKLAGAGRNLIEPLTDREVQVLNLLAEGRTNKDIASELVITERTVKFHVSSILAKLGVSNRTEAIRAAAHLGLVKL